MLHFYTQNELISHLMPATGLKNVDMEKTQGLKSKTFWKYLAGRTSSN